MDFALVPILSNLLDELPLASCSGSPRSKYRSLSEVGLW